MGRVQNKTVIVTGAASGVGLEVAHLMADEGANVVVADLRADMAGSVAQEIGGSALAISLDVREDESWCDLMAGTLDHFGRIDVLVNNAGIAKTGNIQDIDMVSLKDWRAVQSVNVEGVLLGCQHAIRVMKMVGGSIINISSIAGMVATPNLAAYGASKAAVRQLTKSVALHCAQLGYKIRCNSVHPGLIATGLFENSFTVEERVQRLESIPLGEFGKPEDVAAMVLYLASDESRHVTGAKFIIDGGMTMG